MCARRWLRDGLREPRGEPSRISSKDDCDLSDVETGVEVLNAKPSGLAFNILEG